MGRGPPGSNATTRFAAAGLALVLVTVAAPLPSALGATGDRYQDWSLDEDGDRLHDALDEALAAGQQGPVLVELHYDRRPTARDQARLEEHVDVQASYVYSNWDDILARVPTQAVPELLELPGVLAVEKMPKVTPTLDTSVQAIRAREAEAPANGVDHTKGVHEDLGYRGEGQVIAVLDTGVDNTHEMLDDLDDDPTTVDPKIVTKTDPATGAGLVAGADVNNMLQPVGCVDPPDSLFHGTHVAGIAAGTVGESGTNPPGVAPKARIVDVAINGFRFFGSLDGIGPALDWILDYQQGETCFGDPGPHAIDVVTMSLSVPSDDPDSTLNLKITDVVRAGMTFAISAGNSGTDAETLTGGAEGGIYVAAIDNAGSITRGDDAVDDYSSRGPRTEDGDGDTIDELRPDVAAPGTAISSALIGSRTARTDLSGTSMAAPHTAGVAALVLQANPSLRPVDQGTHDAMGDAGAVPVRDVMQQSAEYRTATVGEQPQQEQTGRFGETWNNAWGYGYLDAYDAVTLGLSS